MSEDNDDSTTVLEMIMNPNKTLANWFVSLGLLGLFLAVLNIIGCIHPNYRRKGLGSLLHKTVVSYLKSKLIKIF